MDGYSPLITLQIFRQSTIVFTLGAPNVDGVQAFGSVTIPLRLMRTIIVLNVGIRKAQISMSTSGPLLTFSATQLETQHLGDKSTHHPPETLHGQLSLLDYLDSYLPPGEDPTGGAAQLPEFD
jgi:hypothetical protein